MNDIELLQRYARRRQNYRKWDFFANNTDTDLQSLSKHEMTIWVLNVILLVNLRFLTDSLCSGSLLLKLAAAGALVFCVYLVFDLFRIQRLRRLFECTAVQGAAELATRLEEQRSAETSRPDVA